MSQARPSPERFQVLFREHAGFVEAVLRKQRVAEADLDDLVQEVFVVVYRKVEAFEGRSALRTWLHAVAFHVASQYRRRAHRRRERPDDEVCAGQMAPDDPLRDTERRRFADDLRRAIDALDDDRRRVFVMHELEERPMSEVAVILGCPVKTGFSRLYSARRIIRKGMAKRGWVLAPGPVALPPSFDAARLDPALPKGAWSSPGVPGIAARMPGLVVSALCGALLLTPWSGPTAQPPTVWSRPADAGHPPEAELARRVLPRFNVVPDEGALERAPAAAQATWARASGRSPPAARAMPTSRRMAIPASRRPDPQRLDTEPSVVTTRVASPEREADFWIVRTTSADVRRPSPWEHPPDRVRLATAFDPLAGRTNRLAERTERELP